MTDKSVVSDEYVRDVSGELENGVSSEWMAE